MDKKTVLSSNNYNIHYPDFNTNEYMEDLSVKMSLKCCLLEQ